MAEEDNSGAQKSGRLLCIDTDEFGELQFSKPKRQDYHRFVSQVADDKRDKFVAMVALVQSCAVSPTGQALDDVIDEYPGLVSDISARLIDMATPTIRATVKKGS